MKKYLLTVAVAALVAVSANAQVWVGGEFGFTFNHENGSNVTEKTFDIKPTVGYNLSDNLAVAIELGFSHLSNPSTAIEVPNQGGSTTNVTNTWSIKPFARYTFLKAGSFSAFVDGGLNFATTHYRGYKKNGSTFGAFVKPGIAYNVSEKVSLVAHLGDGLYFNHTGMASYEGDTGATPKYGAQVGGHSNAWGLKLINSISFGAYYNF